MIFFALYFHLLVISCLVVCNHQQGGVQARIVGGYNYEHNTNTTRVHKQKRARQQPQQNLSKQQQQQQQRQQRQQRQRQLQWQDQNCPVMDPDPDQIALELSKEFLIDKVNVTKQLSSLVSPEHSDGKSIQEVTLEQRKNPFWEIFDGFSARSDQALVAKVASTQICFATFQSTVNQLDMSGIDPIIQYLSDQWQNINPFTSWVEDCKIRKGYIEVYNSTYGDDLRHAINACVASCTTNGNSITHGKPCQLVLGGESAGGAGAVVASIDLSHYHPEVITWGAPRVIAQNSLCSAVDPHRHYRFVNTNQKKYDCVPNQINLYNEKHVGWPILLDGLYDYPISTPGLNDNRSRQPTTMEIHEWTLYMERIEAIVERNCFPVLVAKWPDPHYCHYNDECLSQYCDNNVCKTGLR